MPDLKAPFPWFGGKSRVSDIVWDQFGDVDNYVEPFAGSLAVLLGRPTPPQTETINDLDCMVANFWRALQCDPEAVAQYADWPVNEADQHARHLWLCSQAEFRERMKTEPDFYDAKIAGWWVWGQCIWIGSGWCSVQLPHLGNAGKGLNRQLPHLGDAGKGLNRQLPHLGDAGTGVHRKRPHLGNAGKGLNRQLPHLGDAGKGLNRQLPHLGDAGTGVEESAPTSGMQTGDNIRAYMQQLSERLRRVRVCCGDWQRICGPSVTIKHGVTGVFLDPPYGEDAERQEGLYASDSVTVARSVLEWAIEAGKHPDMRVALCGYAGEHVLPDDWDCIAWKAAGGYGSQGAGSGRDNSSKERIWFSPACLRQPSLFRTTIANSR